MTRRVDIWSDIHCPWALIAVHRLRRARARLGAEVVFVPRAWPLEWVNRRGTPRDILSVEVAALASHEPELFNAYAGESWPSTFLPAFELVAAAARTGGAELAEHVDYALRIAFFRDSVDVSIEAGLRRSLDIALEYRRDCDVEGIMSAWRTQNVRADVVRDFTESQGVRIQGSPQIVWPDGTSVHNPGMTDHHWSGGLVRITSTDPMEPGRLLAESLCRDAADPPGPPRR
ncbi:DsbA family oxidoreductase [Nonomuraea guangzhouensis]|uniref:DsbA family protein n=1 Tax=Nonomuraea guangzhouensis TaxID=1291555 RepID=A0ABW4G839_9ACTN|nr:DsbA family protein [Nonomuraea guangzhouensis]